MGGDKTVLYQNSRALGAGSHVEDAIGLERYKARMRERKIRSYSFVTAMGCHATMALTRTSHAFEARTIHWWDVITQAPGESYRFRV